MTSAARPTVNRQDSGAPGDSWAADWERTYGSHWAAMLVVLCLLFAIRGSLETLTDPDLPMHLAIGEWIARHRAVPIIEPFAWTRMGAPFYAYSWALDLSLYELARLTGKIGLRVFQGLMMGASAAAMIVLGWAARWQPRTSLVMAALNAFVLGLVVTAVRPQAILFVLIPLAWAFTYRSLYSARPRGSLIALGVISAIAVNTHIFFPLVAVPWLLWVAEPPNKKSRIYAVIGVTLIGWLVTPYLLSWPAMFTSSLRPNLMLLPPTPVREAQPGFVAMGTYLALVPIAFFLVSIPLQWSGVNRSRSFRLVWGSAWLLGLVAFAIASRMLLVWWMLVLPLVATAVQEIADRLMASEAQSVRLWRITTVWGLCALLIFSVDPFDADAWRFEDPAGRHRLAPMKETGLDQIANWLECNTRQNSHGRVFTVFNYGSALTWRLHHYSMSIDGRTIFPDTVAKAEVFYKPFGGEPISYGPWRSAELAIVPVGSGINTVMADAPDWHQVAIVETFDNAATLWVTEKWWLRFGTTPLPRFPWTLAPPDERAGRNSCAGLARKGPPRERSGTLSPT